MAGMDLGLGLGLGIGRRSSGGVAPAYAPGAISITPESIIQSGQLNVTDSNVGIMSVWLRGNFGPAATGSTDNYSWDWFLRDVLTNVGVNGVTNSEINPGFNYTSGEYPVDNLGPRGNWNDSTGSTNHNILGTQPGTIAAYNATWHHHLLAWDFSTASRKAALYYDGVKITSFGVADVGTVAANFIVNLNNSNGFGFGSNAGNNPGTALYDIAQFFLDNHTTGLVSSGSLSAGTLAKFITLGGAPVDLGISAGTKGSLPLGTAPELFFDTAPGSESTWNTNLGTSNATFALTKGARVAALQPLRIYQASSGPAGPWSSRPYVHWRSAIKQGGGTSTIRTMNNGQPIALGDMLVTAVMGTDGSGSATRTLTIDQSFSLAVGGSQHVLGGDGSNFNCAFATKVADINDVTAAGANWTNSPTWTFATAATRSVATVMINLGPCSLLDSGFTAKTASSSNVVAPSVTPGVAASTLLSLYCHFDPGNAGRTSLPASQNLRFKNEIDPGTFNGVTYIMIGDEPITGSGATGTRTATQTTASCPAAAVNLVFA